jgi:hypothetical protein
MPAADEIRSAFGQVMSRRSPRGARSRAKTRTRLRCGARPRKTGVGDRQCRNGNLQSLVAHAERNDLAYEYEYTPAFAKRERLLSPEQYQIVEVRTSRGVSRVMLFSKAIIQAEWEANAPLREAMAIKRERLRALRAKRAAKQRRLPTNERLD